MGIHRFLLDAEYAKSHFTSPAGLEIRDFLQPREESAHLGDLYAKVHICAGICCLLK